MRIIFDDLEFDELKGSSEPVWTDEFDTTPVVQAVQYTTGHVHLAWETKVRGGLPITLSFADPNLLTGKQVLALWQKAQVEGAIYHLSCFSEVRGQVSFNVRLRHVESKAFSAQGTGFRDDSKEPMFTATLNFITVP